MRLGRGRGVEWAGGWVCCVVVGDPESSEAGSPGIPPGAPRVPSEAEDAAKRTCDHEGSRTWLGVGCQEG